MRNVELKGKVVRRVLIVSPIYLNPANRGKLRALAARDLDVTVGVPERLREAALGRTVEAGWERQNGVEVFPIPVRHWTNPDEARFRKRPLISLLRDKRPDVVQVEQEPTTRVCQQVVRVARKLKFPVVLFTLQNVELSLRLFPRARRRRRSGAAPHRPRSPRRGSAAARRPGAARAGARAARGARDRVRGALGAGEGSRYFAAGARREPRGALAPVGGGRRARPRAARAHGQRAAARCADPLDRRAAARGDGAALGRAGRAGAAVARARELGRAVRACRGRGDGA